MTSRDIWTRGVYAAFILMLLYLLVFSYLAPQWGALIVAKLKPVFGPQGAVFAGVGIFTALPVVVTVGLLTVVDRYARAKRDGDFEVRCRKCRHILRGITEPRCPECGERI